MTHSAGSVYATDGYTNSIWKFASDWTYVTRGGGTEGNGNGQFPYPEGIAVNASGYLYVVDTGNNRIQEFTPDGTYVTQGGVGGTGTGRFGNRGGVAVNANGYIYVTGQGDNRIRKFFRVTSGRFILSKLLSGIASLTARFTKAPGPEPAAFPYLSPAVQAVPTRV